MTTLRTPENLQQLRRSWSQWRKANLRHCLLQGIRRVRLNAYHTLWSQCDFTVDKKQMAHGTVIPTMMFSVGY